MLCYSFSFLGGCTKHPEALGVSCILSRSTRHPEALGVSAMRDTPVGLHSVRQGG